MTKVLPYSPEHLEQITPKEIHRGELPQVVCTDAMTVVLDSKPIAILGLFWFVPGVLHLWAILSEDIRRKPIAFHKTCLRLLKHYQNLPEVRRIQVEVRQTYLEGQKWIESLGFVKEGLMRKFSPDGEDNFLYGRTRCQQ